jgi:membrane-associated protease RseP (regulator of RpoE activity)
VPLLAGEEIFQKFAVAIDFSHHRIAFRDATKIAKPKSAVEVPIVELNGERVVPVSVNGAPVVQFEFELGNASGPLLTSPVYAKEHDLLEGVKTSQRLSGRFIETIFMVKHLGFAGVETPAAPIALIPDSEVPPPAIAGGVGLPLIERFDMIIDYPHDRIFATPHKDAATVAFFKDRLGLVVARQKEAGFEVTFVSPGSPAANAGFKLGDKIASIGDKTAESLPFIAMWKLRFTETGTAFTFGMADGSERKVTAADFF